MNVVYVDLKPQNILIFRDWQVKLGDFGGAIRFRNDRHEYSVKSYTPQYASKEFIEKFKQTKNKFSKEDLMEHEYYSLWKTFQSIEEELIKKNLLTPNSKFGKLVKVLKVFEYSLEKKIIKWQKIF